MDVVNRNLYGLPGNRQQRLTLYDLSDLHKGARGHAREILLEAVACIKADPCARWIGGGDWFDSILPGDKRFDLRLEDALDPHLWAKARRNIGI